MKERKIRIGVTLDRATLDRLRDEAELDSRPLSQYLNLLLIRYFNSIDKKRQDAELRKKENANRISRL